MSYRESSDYPKMKLLSMLYVTLNDDLYSALNHTDWSNLE